MSTTPDLPHHDALSQARRILEGETLALPTRLHLHALRTELDHAQSELRIAQGATRILAERLHTARSAEREALTVLGALLTTLDAVADPETPPATRCRLAQKAAASARQFLTTEQESRG